MTKFKSAILILSAFIMLAACGEKFRAKQISSAAENPANLNNNNNGGDNNGGGDNVVVNPIEGQTPVSVDQAFANRYSDELSDTAGSQQLANAIRAFSVTKRLVSPNIDSVTMEANIALACGQIEIVRAVFDITQLKPAQVLRISGSWNNSSFVVDLQCNDTNCNEMSAAIHHFVNGESRTVLTGLIKNDSKSQSTVHQMEPNRGVSVAGYRQFNNVIDYSIACVPETNNGGEVNNGGSNFVLDPTNVGDPTNIETTNTNPPLSEFFSL